MSKSNEDVTFDDALKFIFLLVLAYVTPEELEKTFSETKQKAEFLEEKQRMCPMVEWVQDMGATIPFCRLDGKFCEYQCLSEKERLCNQYNFIN